MAVILSDAGAQLPAKESAAIVFVHDAFARLKAIGVHQGGQSLLEKANIEKDQGVFDIAHINGVIAAAKTRQWERESSLRRLA